MSRLTNDSCNVLVSVAKAADLTLHIPKEERADQVACIVTPLRKSQVRSLRPKAPGHALAFSVRKRRRSALPA